MLKENKKAVIVGDTQFPFHDSNAIELLYTFLEDYQPQTIFLNGDMIDCFEISDFDKEPIKNKTLEKELKLMHNFLVEIRYICPDARIVWIFGNHEFRLRKFIYRNAPEFRFSLDNLIERDTKTEELDVEIVQLPSGFAKFADTYIKYEGYLIGHFNKVTKHSAYTAKALVEDNGVNIIQNHTHRAGSYYKTTHDRLLEGHETGSLCSPMTYTRNPNWQQGWGLLETIDKTTNYYQIIIKGGKFVFNGKLYK